ncbi:MAG TPA: glycerol-3-phosphate 1-O-acyltransferase PlsY [Nitrosomonas sp.]|nr:glycerol-3-phosphate 1-O-acyltransferase PlsY [Nitrosomonas sp.]HQU98814.1 glycerol-3-phosphate 1-O-acyltransferase PlsY [Nitrosomonas sp.]HQX13694.1 glycerol-3-phosphate 1-O-acyltransferase PlsY [Nitrosomonas sp.]HRB20470.1 glycerol-3-phosphate 1-O-acyltransferase PlsY [Nitrosomonas sp.]HRB31610.1 glycerol-3-phosphate 1-O-acyltransferase PlsY [Nitrosomonas sp.]
MTLLMFAVIAYLLGSVSFAMISSWLFKLPDPRTYGSKNPGATNVLRSGKRSAAIVTLLGDAGKGWLAVALAQYYAPLWGLDHKAIAVVALSVFLGHIFPVFLRFRGGKGVATAVGVLLGLNIWVGLMAIATWLLTAIVSRISSLSAIVAAILAPIYMFSISESTDYFLAVLIMSMILIWRHQSNIVNLLSGKEQRIGDQKSSQK